MWSRVVRIRGVREPVFNRFRRLCQRGAYVVRCRIFSEGGETAPVCIEARFVRAPISSREPLGALNI